MTICERQSAWASTPGTFRLSDVFMDLYRLRLNHLMFGFDPRALNQEASLIVEASRYWKSGKQKHADKIVSMPREQLSGPARYLMCLVFRDIKYTDHKLIRGLEQSGYATARYLGMWRVADEETLGGFLRSPESLRDIELAHVISQASSRGCLMPMDFLQELGDEDLLMLARKGDGLKWWFNECPSQQQMWLHGVATTLAGGVSYDMASALRVRCMSLKFLKQNISLMGSISSLDPS